MRVSLVTCVWQRRALTRAFWVWATWLKQRWLRTHGIDLSLIAGVSTKPDAWTAEPYGVHLVWHDNEPLGAKFNAALTAAREHDPAWVLIMGSDDFFCSTMADHLADAMLAGRSVGFQDLYFADLPTGKMRYWPGYFMKSRRLEPAGCGTTHGRALLDKLNWRLWDATRHHGMDHSRFATLTAHAAMPELLNVKALGGIAVDVKGGGVNLWPYDRKDQFGTLPTEDMTAVWEKLPVDVLAAIPWPADEVALQA